MNRKEANKLIGKKATYLVIALDKRRSKRL